MLRNTRIALKYLVFGLLIGLLFAPRSGQETRRMLWSEIVDYVSHLLDSGRDRVSGEGGGRAS